VHRPPLYQRVAGDPLARGEVQTGGSNIRLVIPTTTYEEAVHGVVISLIRQFRKWTRLPSGGDKDFNTDKGTISTRQDDPWNGDLHIIYFN
jgi:hypothetical protein